MLSWRRTAVAAIVGLLVWSIAPAAFAAAPTNDSPSSPMVISTSDFPFYDSVVTTEATREGDPNSQCAAGLQLPPANSIWYQITLVAGERVVFDTSRTTYSTGTAVYADTAGSLTEVTCWVGSLGVFESPDDGTYLVGFAEIYGEGGGDFFLRVDQAPPAVTASFTVGSRATVSKTGTMQLSGNVTCNTPAYANVYGNVTQQAGRFVARGEGYWSGVCSPTPTRWFATADSSTGVLFKAGKATATVNLDAGDGITYYYSEPQVVQLKLIRR